MFKIEDGKIKFSGFEIIIPQEVMSKKIVKVFGTSTFGLETSVGYVIQKNGAQVSVRTEQGVVEAVLVKDNGVDKTTTLFLREQFDMQNKSFWIASQEPIEPQLNWINAITEDGAQYKFCPFTFEYVQCQ